MKQLFPLVLAALIALPAFAQEAETAEAPMVTLDAGAVDLSEFLWKKRPLVVFADTPEDPRFVQQVELLNERRDVLEERDVVIITDTDPAAKSDLRRKLRPRGFALVIMGKDGRVELRKPLPWDVREISRAIDKMPLRQREIREALEDS